MLEIKTLLKNARKSRELTLAQVSKATGIAITTINSWERGASYPRGKNRDIIAEFYKLPAHSLDYSAMNPNTDSREFDIGRITQDISLAEYDSKVIRLHKKHWETAEMLREKAGDVDFNEFFTRLVKVEASKKH